MAVDKFDQLLAIKLLFSKKLGSKAIQPELGTT
jgi:hypothetical protein